MKILLLGKNGKIMLRLAKDHDTLSVVAGQEGAPTSADLIGDVTALALQEVLQDPQLAGLYHLAADGEVSWQNYAMHITEFTRSNGEQLAVKAISQLETNEYSTAARCHLNSRLNTEKLRDSFSLHLPFWQTGVDPMLREFSNK